MVIDKFDGEYRFLSNFYHSPLFYNGLNYPTVEHAFQAQKTVHKEAQAKIAAAPTPEEAKHMGRSVPLRIDWEDIKEKVMLDLLRLKFTKGSLLANYLDETGDATLIEGTTWHDRFWGVCNCEKCQGQGKNMLGTLLMRVREENRK